MPNFSARKRILLVEDDDEAARVLEELLEKHEYDVMSVPDGAEALKHVATFLPNAVLLDLVLPRMDGRTFLQALKGTALASELPVIIVSAEPATLPDGAVAYIRKPVEPDRLLELVKTYAR